MYGHNRLSVYVYIYMHMIIVVSRSNIARPLVVGDVIEIWYQSREI
jgi:hypothetical protein